MKKSLLIYLALLTLALYSCHDNFQEVADDCIICDDDGIDTPIDPGTGGPDGPDGPDEPDPDPDDGDSSNPSEWGNTCSNQQLYDQGIDIGRLDAKYIVEQSFYRTSCINLSITADWHDLANQVNDWSDIVHEDLVQIDEAFKVKKFDKQCYYTTASEKQVFYEFVQDYKDLVRDAYLENIGTERECYWRGIYDGFSLQLCYDSFKVKFVTGCETLPSF